MNIIFFAPPAAGKGTYSDLLQERHGYNHISPGELFREQVANKTEIGSYLKETMDKGMMIDDKIVKKVIEEKLETLDLSKPIVIDGYLRTESQIPDFESIVEKYNINVDKEILINISKETGLKRKLSRLVCPSCKRGYNTLNPSLIPLKEGICDECGTELITRTDDTKEAYESLYEIYLKDTMPVIEYFRNKGILEVVDGEKAPEEVFKQIENIIGVKND